MAAFAVKAQLSIPETSVLPAELGVNATYMLSDGADLRDADVRLIFWPPEPCIPEASCAPSWALDLPAGCFVPGHRGDYRLKEKSCAASLTRTAADGTETDQSAYLVGVDGKVEPPTQEIQAYRMRIEVSFMLDNGTTIPPSPCRGSTTLRVGDEVGEAQSAACSWEGVQ